MGVGQCCLVTLEALGTNHMIHKACVLNMLFFLVSLFHQISSALLTKFKLLCTSSFSLIPRLS